MIFDTSFIIDLMDRNGNALLKLNDIIKRGDSQLVTSLTIFELFSGLVRSKRPVDEKNKILKVLEGQTILVLDKESAEKAGEIDGHLISEGKCIGAVDCMIAGITLTKKEKLVTKDIKDFSRIKGLELETY